MTDPLQQLKAYCSDDSKCRGVHTGHSNYCKKCDAGAWIFNLLPLIEAAATRPCCKGATECEVCGKPWGFGTGQVPDPHAQLRVCVGVARACLETLYPHSYDHPDDCACRDDCDGGPERRAVEAAEAYLEQPAEERLGAWAKTILRVEDLWVPMPYTLLWADAKCVPFFEAQAKILGPRFRAAVLAALPEAVQR